MVQLQLKNMNLFGLISWTPLLRDVLLSILILNCHLAAAPGFAPWLQSQLISGMETTLALS